MDCVRPLKRPFALPQARFRTTFLQVRERHGRNDHTASVLCAAAAALPATRRLDGRALRGLQKRLGGKAVKRLDPAAFCDPRDF